MKFNAGIGINGNFHPVLSDAKSHTLNHFATPTFGVRNNPMPAHNRVASNTVCW